MPETSTIIRAATTEVGSRTEDPAASVPPVSSEFAVDSLQGPEYRKAPLGRSRFLGSLSASLFGTVAASLVKTSEAFACHTATIPTYCDGPSKGCCCCDSGGCCSAGCTRRNSGCGSTGNGWYVLINAGGGCYNRYFCGDWQSGSDPCICRIYLGKVC